MHVFWFCNAVILSLKLANVFFFLINSVPYSRLGILEEANLDLALNEIVCNDRIGENVFSVKV